MNRHLPDVNVLLALVWPRHECHAAAHAWFAKSGQRAWATNPLTQLGVLRLLTNPAVTDGVVTAATAWDVLSEATRHPGHEFWPLDRDTPAGIELMVGRIRGHRQWTDALLLWHAMEHESVFVTFDSGVKELATGNLRNNLLLLKR
ncbi:MAG: VapC toxin family PIN domain ribonuclease [Acidobacteriota bacterium]|nr:VapC toxin family PIN domain ribonuclease [Acidobacteriota bacterium]